MIIMEKQKLRILLAMPLAIFLLGGSCGDVDVAVVSDVDEIKRYLTDNADGKDFFSKTGIIHNTEFSVVFDTAIYKEIVDSSFRTTSVAISDQAFDFGNLGILKEALAIVTDNYYVTTFRIAGVDTTFAVNVRKLTRYGYFLKLGDDGKPFLGWKLYGFNSLGTVNPPANVELSSLDGQNKFFGDQRAYTEATKTFVIKYQKLTDIKSFQKGESIIARMIHSPSARYYHLISAENSNGGYTEPMYRTTNELYTDTVITRSVNSKFWNLILFQSFKEDTTAADLLQFWAVPYKAL